MPEVWNLPIPQLRKSRIKLYDRYSLTKKIHQFFEIREILLLETKLPSSEIVMITLKIPDYPTSGNNPF